MQVGSLQWLLCAEADALLELRDVVALMKLSDRAAKNICVAIILIVWAALFFVIGNSFS